MTLIIVLIVFAVEFYFNWGAQYRNAKWFDLYHLKFSEWFNDIAFYQGWGGIACLLGAPILLLSLVLFGFAGAIQSILLFVISGIILFLAIGPKSLSSTLDPYYAAMERGDAEAAYLSLEQEGILEGYPQSDELVRNVTRTILIEGQTRYFGVVFWFIFFGPFGALFYRMTHLYAAVCIKNNDEENLDKISILIFWIDWLPARLTSILFLLTGDFVNGFHRVKDYFMDFSADNKQIISETGMASLGLEMGVSDGDIKENRDTQALIERTLILYIVAVAALSPLAFW